MTEPQFPPHVLVVEDTISNSRLLEAHLAGDGFRVTLTSEGASALAALDARDFDIVLLDVMLPGMDGFEVCRRIRANARAAALPVIMVTALDVDDARREAGVAGADDYFVKPVDYPALFAAMRNLLGDARSKASRRTESSLNAS